MLASGREVACRHFHCSLSMRLAVNERRPLSQPSSLPQGRFLKGVRSPGTCRFDHPAKAFRVSPQSGRLSGAIHTTLVA